MRKNFASLAVGAFSLFLLLIPSCSLVYDLDPDQCASNGDCVALFGQGHTCELGICTCKSASCMGGAGGKSGSSGGMSGNNTEGGTGAKGGSGETGGDAGMGGAPVEPECTSHKDCFTLYPDDSEENPRACVEGACVPLITPECPAVLPLSDNGSWNLLKSTNAIILGAFAPLTGTAINTYGRNYDLAVTELSKTTQGVYAGSTKRRQIVVVLCKMLFPTQDGLLVPSKHLMEELKVPGVASTLLLQDQAYVWENVARDNGVFMMMPNYSNQALIDEPDDGLIWHMLSGANALSVSYQPLLDKTVQHLKALGDLGASENLKVAQVKATDEAFLQDTANFIEKNVKFNGQSMTANLDASLYLPVEVTSVYKAPEDPQTKAIEAILAFGPHVVIGSTVSEMLQYIIPGVESGWATAHPSQKRPFYLLGALDYNDGAMAPLIKNDSTLSGQGGPLYQRILGVNWPAAVDQTVYEDYQTRWTSAYGHREEGYENFYDAMYYLMYGVAAARAPLTGAQIAAGLLRVTAIGSKIPQVAVGPSPDMATYVNRLASDTSSKIELIGAMGPPNWDVYGGRNDPGSVWCVNPLGVYKPDQLRYD
ncbi:MAG TPA: hypothetical protein VHM25_24620, partial [Polyangiaceae bacterium]|nr:hypothetical protein [Polyangiaceae bacterium]